MPAAASVLIARRLAHAQHLRCRRSTAVCGAVAGEVPSVRARLEIVGEQHARRAARPRRRPPSGRPAASRRAVAPPRRPSRPPPPSFRPPRRRAPPRPALPATPAVPTRARAAAAGAAPVVPAPPGRPRLPAGRARRPRVLVAVVALRAQARRRRTAAPPAAADESKTSYPDIQQPSSDLVSRRDFDRLKLGRQQVVEHERHQVGRAANAKRMAYPDVPMLVEQRRPRTSETRSRRASPPSHRYPPPTPPRAWGTCRTSVVNRFADQAWWAAPAMPISSTAVQGPTWVTKKIGSTQQAKMNMPGLAGARAAPAAAREVSGQPAARDAEHGDDRVDRHQVDPALLDVERPTSS